jgi:dTDP-4-amino-4,6-dideoxygalactose transaminase
LLDGLPLQTPPAAEPGTRHSRHLYQVLVEPQAPLERDELLDGLAQRNIGAGVHYRGVHLHPYYRDRYGLVPEQLPVATAISDRTLSLPLSPKVSEADQDDTVTALRELLSR